LLVTTCIEKHPAFKSYALCTGLKGALNPNFLNLTIEKKFGSKNVLVSFLNLLLLLKSYEDFTFNIHSKVLLESGVSLSFKNQSLQLDF